MITLRPYQETAVSGIVAELHNRLNVLLEAPTGAGKTIMFSAIIQRLLQENPHFRILVLMDRHILVTQTEEKLRTLAPELGLDIGLCCATISSIKDIEKRIVIASRQSLVNQLNQFEGVNLCIVDECHLMSMPGSKGHPDQFSEIVERLRQYKPGMRLLGCTATPFRLNDGYIFGNKHAPELLPYWDSVHHKIRITDLQRDGYLAGLKGYTSISSGMAADLDDLPLVGGEYNMLYLSDTMEKFIHLQSAIDIWKQYASERKKTIVFCVSIAHADKLAEAFNQAGIPAISIHSELDDFEYNLAMRSIKGDSEHKIFCSVGQLTTGFDEPSIDAILLCRPTKSASLYKQMLGRGMRIHSGKDNCLVLDICGLNAEFGTDLDELKIHYKKAKTKDGIELVDGKNKECPKCLALVHPAVRICPECQFEFPVKEHAEAGTPEMTETQYGIQPELPIKLDVSAMYPKLHVSKKTEKELLQIRFEFENMVSASLWFCFEGDGYSGFAIEKGAKLWHKLTQGHDEPYPNNAQMAYGVSEILIKMPDWCEVRRDGKYWNIIDFGWYKKGEAWEPEGESDASFEFVQENQESSFISEPQ